MGDEPNGADALRDILATLRMESSLISRAKLSAPHCVSSNGLPGRAIFHAVASGSCMLRLTDRGEPVELHAGDVALLTHGSAHIIGDHPDRIATPINTIPMTESGTVPLLEYGGGGATVRIVCGTFGLQHAAAVTMLEGLPPLLIARGHGEGSGVGLWLEQTIELLAGELEASASASPVAARLTDVLVMHVLRATAEQTPDLASGWLSALRDEKIGRALATIHRKPSEGWTASTLAASVGMSRSSFFARFSELVGEPPARYLARWRMWVAADMMSSASLSTGQLAERVGYASEDAFSRVFKRIMGVSPGEFRRRLVTSA